ncbi:hypothetical protein PENSPDRAFT_687549 [Peniophora sp. CONT]|nr:hypothetical protein PENSPDRAFT_687549 [Peniophora sp. CONT]
MPDKFPSPFLESWRHGVEFVILKPRLAMVKEWGLVNLDKREWGPADPYLDNTMDEPLCELVELLKSLEEPPRNIPEKWLPRPNATRADLGNLGVLPPELVDTLFSFLTDAGDVVCFSVSHLLLLQRGFPRLVELLRVIFKTRSWSGDLIIFMDEHLDAIPNRLLSSAEKEEFEGIVFDDDEYDSPSGLLDYLRDRCEGCQRPSFIVMSDIKELREAHHRPGWPYLPLGLKSWHQASPADIRVALDCSRIRAIIHEATPSPFSHKRRHGARDPELALCNLSQHLFVRSKAIDGILRHARWSDRSDAESKGKLADLGHVVILMTACSDYMPSTIPRYDLNQDELFEREFKGKIGAWSGDRLSIVPVGELETGMKDVSDEVAAILHRWYELNVVERVRFAGSKRRYSARDDTGSEEDA